MIVNEFMELVVNSLEIIFFGFCEVKLKILFVDGIVYLVLFVIRNEVVLEMNSLWI